MKKILLFSFLLFHSGIYISAQYIRAYGDSFTEGIGANSYESYPNVLSQLLGVAVNNYGYGYQTSTNVVDRILLDSANKNNATIIWCGRNNYNDTATVFYDIQRAVNSLGHERYLILPTWASSQINEAIGTPTYNLIMGMNQRLSEIYGLHYVPVRELMVKDYDPNLTDDSASFALDMVAARYRFQIGLHPNRSGYEEIANILSQYSVELGFAAMPGRWLGTISSDINNPANWQGGIPTRNTNVVIHAGTTFLPQISSTLICRNFNIGKGVNLTITGKLKISGKIMSAGTLYMTDGTIEFIGLPDQMIPPSTIENNNLKDLIINYNTDVPKHYAQAFTSPTPTGNYSYLGELAAEFTVNDSGGILISQLGAFDHNSNGISGTQSGGVRVAIFDKNTQTIVPGLDVTISGSSDPLIGYHRMQTITPVVLPQGSYLIVSKGYNSGELYGYRNPGDAKYGTDNGGGKLTIIKSYAGPNTSSGFNYPTIEFTEEVFAFLSGTFIYKSESVGASLAGKLNISGNVIIESGALHTHDFLTLKSNENGTARIAEGDTLGGYLHGTVTVERFIPLGKRAYRQLSSGVNTLSPILQNWQEGKPISPIAGQGIHITGSTAGANGFDQTNGGGVSMFTYKAGAPNFTSIGNTNIKTLNALQAYRVFINGDRLANLTILLTTAGTGTPNILMNNEATTKAAGTIITGPVIFNETSASANGIVDTTNKLSNLNGAFNLVPNPYWSPIDFDKIYKSEISQTYWLWDPALGNRGGYVTYNTLTGSTPGSNITKDIQPGQAIFIQTTGSNPVFIINEKDKSDLFTNTFRTAQETPSKLSIKLFTNVALSNGKGMQDGTIVAFRDDFFKDISTEDAPKFTNTDENIAIKVKNKMVAIEGRPNVVKVDTIQINLWKLYPNNNYTLQIEGIDFETGFNGVLIDRYLHTQTCLNLQGSINIPFSFTTDSASYYDRFLIVINKLFVLPVISSNLKGYSTASGIQLEWIVLNENNVKEYSIERSINGLDYSIIGKMKAKSNLQENVNYYWLDNLPLAGNNYYRIKIISTDNTSNFTNIVRFNLFAGSVNFNVFPNPVTDKKLSFVLNGLNKGNYTVTLSTQSGQVVLSKSIIHSGNAISETLQLPLYLASGIYNLSVNNGNEIIKNQEIIIK